jgi:hypothetical protein
MKGRPSNEARCAAQQRIDTNGGGCRRPLARHNLRDTLHSQVHASVQPRARYLLGGCLPFAEACPALRSSCPESGSKVPKSQRNASPARSSLGERAAALL